LVNFKVDIDDPSNLTASYVFAARCHSWKDMPSISTENKSQFGIKISGAVTRDLA
jgi:hypothetical protein